MKSEAKAYGENDGIHTVTHLTFILPIQVIISTQTGKVEGG